MAYQVNFLSKSFLANKTISMRFVPTKYILGP